MHLTPLNLVKNTTYYFILFLTPILGHGSSERYSKCPTDLFFHSDYRPLLRDSFHNVVDEQTQLPPHLLPPPFLVDSEGDPYPTHIQRFVRGREQLSERDGLVPIGKFSLLKKNPIRKISFLFSNKVIFFT